MTTMQQISDFPLMDGRCNCFAVKRASRYLTAVYDKGLSPAGIRITQFSILHKIVRSERITMGELAVALGMDRTTLTANLRPLERDGLISIVPGEDRRMRVAAATKAGVKKYSETIPLWNDVQSKFEAAFGNPAAAQLRHSLRAVLDSGFDPWGSDSPRPAGR